MKLEKYLKKSFSISSFLLLIVLSIYFFVIGFLPGWNKINSDFPNYYTSSKLISEGKNLSNIYNDAWFQNEILKYGIDERGKFSPFPPVTSFVMLIPSAFNPLSAKRIYLIFNLLVLFLTAYFLFKITSYSFINCLIFILLSGVGIVNNFLLGQFYLILLFLIVFGYYLFQVKKSFFGGLIWGIGASIKYFPFIFIPVFLKKGRWKLVIGFLTAVIFINIIGLYVFGFGVYKDFILTAFLPHLNGSLSNQSLYAHQFQSWNSFLSNVFIYDKIENPFPLINWQLGFTIVRGIIYLSVIFLTFLSLIKLKRSSQEVLLSICLLSVVLLLLSPASASYHFLLLVFPTILLLSHNFKNGDRIYGLIFLVIYILIGFLPIILHRIISNYETNLFFAFHRLWLITIYFILLINYLLVVVEREKEKYVVL